MARTINDIIPPSRRRMMGETVPNSMAPTPSLPPTSSDEPPRAVPPKPFTVKPPRRGFPFGTLIVAVLVIAACGGLLYAFSGAKVEVTPTQNPITVDAALTATAATGDLPFETVAVDKVAIAGVPAETTSNVTVPAQGTIIILNAQSVPQPLITNTRFATSDGKIFRIHTSVTVPAGSSASPGQVTATAYADQPGPAYNIGPSTFTLPGLKSGSSYTLVTAKSTAPMTGGFQGQRASVSSATSLQQQAKEQVQLANDLKQAIAAKVPSGYVLIPGATFTQFEPQPDTAASTSGQVAVSLKGTLTAVVFPKTALAKAIAYKTLGSYGGQPVTIPDASKLTLTPENPDASPAGQGTFAFTLSGSGTILYIVDPHAIATTVAGKTRDSAANALNTLPEVHKANILLRPFWVSTFPQDPAKIQVSTTTKS